MNRDLPDVQAGLRQGRGTRDQVASICWIIEKEKEFWKNTYFCFTDHTKAFDRRSQPTVEDYLRDGNTRPPHLPPQKLYAGQETRGRTRYGKVDWLKIGKGICQGCILSACLSNLCAECMRVC